MIGFLWINILNFFRVDLGAAIGMMGWRFRVASPHILRYLSSKHDISASLGLFQPPLERIFTQGKPAICSSVSHLISFISTIILQITCI